MKNDLEGSFLVDAAKMLVKKAYRIDSEMGNIQHLTCNYCEQSDYRKNPDRNIVHNKGCIMLEALSTLRYLGIEAHDMQFKISKDGF